MDLGDTKLFQITLSHLQKNVICKVKCWVPLLIQSNGFSITSSTCLASRTITDVKTQILDRQDRYIPVYILEYYVGFAWFGLVCFSEENVTMHLFSVLSHKYHFLAYSSYWRLISTIITCGGSLLPSAVLENKILFYFLRKIWYEEKRTCLEGIKRKRKCFFISRVHVKASSFNSQLTDPQFNSQVRIFSGQIKWNY